VRGAKTLELEEGFRRMEDIKWAERRRLKEKVMEIGRWRGIE
jgi:hypothetical protein